MLTTTQPTTQASWPFRRFTSEHSTVRKSYIPIMTKAVPTGTVTPITIATIMAPSSVDMLQSVRLVQYPVYSREEGETQVTAGHSKHSKQHHHIPPYITQMCYMMHISWLSIVYIILNIKSVTQSQTLRGMGLLFFKIKDSLGTILLVSTIMLYELLQLSWLYLIF